MVALNMSNKALIPYNSTLTVEDTSAEQLGKIIGTASFLIQVGTGTYADFTPINDSVLTVTSQNQ